MENQYLKPPRGFQKPVFRTSHEITFSYFRKIHTIRIRIRSQCHCHIITQNSTEYFIMNDEHCIRRLRTVSISLFLTFVN